MPPCHVSLWEAIPRHTGKYGHRFSTVAKATGIKEIQTLFRAPDANTICERFIGTLRRECLDHILMINRKHLHALTNEFVVYYNTCRPHQGLTPNVNQSIPQPQVEQRSSGKVMACPCWVDYITAIDALHDQNAGG